MKKIFLLIVCFILFILSCDYFSLKSYKEWEEKNQKPDVTVYCAGYYSSAGSRACYWEDTEYHDLKDNTLASEVRSVFVFENDVYTAGWCNSRACYWKNDNEIYYLGNNPSKAWSIYVQSGIIFIAGYDYIGGDNKVCYWTITPDGIIKQNFIIDNIASMSVKNGEIYVDENFTIYMAGTIGLAASPTGFYYKSGKGVIYYDSGISEAHSIFVSNGIAYIGGAKVGVACYWKEDQLIYTASLVSYSTVQWGFSIFTTKNNDIYLGCWGNYYIRNKSDIYATGITGGVSSIIMFNDTLYTGTYISGAGYTKGDIVPANNVFLKVPSGAIAHHSAKIFVKARNK